MRYITNPVNFVIKTITDFVVISPLNRMPFDTTRPIFENPLVQFADGDDVLFTQYKMIIAATHFTPREVMAQALHLNPEDLSALSVISWILPVASPTRRSNRRETFYPSKEWAYTRWYGEKFNDALRQHVVQVLMEQGYKAVAPVLMPAFTQFRNEKGPYSNWSERHVAYVAGLGTFSLSDGFITEKGIAHRCGSVVTDLKLPANLRPSNTAFSNCLYYFDSSCKACISRCPAGAISEAGHDKNRCQEYQTKTFAPLRQELQVGNTGCGLCQTSVPCEFKNPARVKAQKGKARK
jgi:epoxyqueuosine reductase